ncbi:MAG: nitroreductase [Nitrospirota bacterium]|nr:nitroreductase [Nitrospirota bacterium]
MEIIGIIKNRRSIRKFRDDLLSGETIDNILEAGRWAPSGLNNQPWRFAVLTDRTIINQLSELTRYSGVVKSAVVLIAVFLDNSASYNRTKDIQAIGACMQNMLLEAHSLGIGAVWLGEIIKSDRQIKNILGLGENLELMAVAAMGYPDERPEKTSRKRLRELIVFRK